MGFFEVLRYALLLIPAVFFVVILLLVMGQGKKNMLQLAKRRASGLKRKIALILVLSIAYAGIYLLTEQLRLSVQASAVISFNYQEASSGLTPNGTRFNASEILSDDVLSTAISNGNFNNVSVDDLRSRLEVVPVTAGETLSVDQSYISTEYQLIYYAGWNTRHLKPQDVVDMVAHAYYDDFINTYSRKTNILEMDYGELEDADYLDIVDYFSAKANSLYNYASVLSSENVSFQSEDTGETFSSIAEKVQNFSDVQLERYEAFVLTYGISDNKSQYIARLNYNNRITSTSYLRNVAAHEVYLEAIDLYQRDMATVVLVPSEDTEGQYYMSRTKIGVDYFADEAEKTMQQAADQQLEIETNNYTINQLLSAGSSDTAAAQADAMVESLKSEYESLYQLMIQTLEEYDRNTTNDYINIQMSSASHISGQDMRTAILLGIVFAGLLCILIIVFPSGNNLSVSAELSQNKMKRQTVRSRRRGIRRAKSGDSE